MSKVAWWKLQISGKVAAALPTITWRRDTVGVREARGLRGKTGEQLVCGNKATEVNWEQRIVFLLKMKVLFVDTGSIFTWNKHKPAVRTQIQNNLFPPLGNKETSLLFLNA